MRYIFGFDETSETNLSNLSFSITPRNFKVISLSEWSQRCMFHLSWKHWFYCRKLRDYLQSNDVVRNDSLRVTLNVGNITVGRHDLSYQLYTYENIIEQPKMEKLCHLKVFEIKVNIFPYIFLRLKLNY